MEFTNQKLQEFEEYIKYRKVAIIGLGVSNIPLIDYFYEKKAKVTVFDSREITEIPKNVMDKITEYSMEFSLGQKYLSKLVGYDLILRSPSCLPTVKELEEEENRGAIVTTEVELLMKMCPCKIIGITGSDGKTTTTTLISEIIKAAGYNCHVGGNIGIPLFTKLSEIMPEDIVVLELSSFQLMGMEVSPDIAVITNISPNHLNVHKDYEEYIEAKKNIYKYQNKDGIVILNYDNEITRECSTQVKGKVIFFSSKNKLDDGYMVDEDKIKQCDDKLRKHLLNTKEITIRGIHNYENICTAIAATRTLVDIDIAVDVCKNFKGVEHRIEFVKEINEVRWYNDSASSTPSRTISALNAFEEEIVLIAGGADKNLDYSPVAKPIVEKVKTLILMGQTADKIFNSVKEAEETENKKINIYMCNSLNQAIIMAKRYATPRPSSFIFTCKYKF
ncbi:MAG: UDP-N-acetylmuramoyl-L-alanine--D-glutamate ligase [Clostridia bacterium]|nr:UDP-N-acetylmuramoyl-L-alanine--D-glutamate ligase [Clostridia bacterium]